MIRVLERWPFAPWLVRSVLAVMALGNVVVLWLMWSATRSASTGLCTTLNDAPFTTFSYPSQVFVFTAIGAYIAGHVTSRYVLEVRPALIAQLGQDAFGRSGIVLAVKAIATGALLIATLLNLYEAYAFASHQWPITYYVWCGTAASPVLALAGTAIISFLVGRWLWVAK